ncbi:MAG: ChaN family lipoprotein [Pseudomonadota bacterium]
MSRSLLGISVAAVLCVGHAASANVFDSFLVDARSSDIVVLGEIHDNPEHHAIQAEAVQALSPDAIVFEMIPQEKSSEVNALRSEGATRNELAEALNWDESGWSDFDFYAPILEAAPSALILGAARPVSDIFAAAESGAAAVFGSNASRFGLDLALDLAELKVRKDEMAVAHCDALPESMLGGMVEVQRLRDADLAQQAVAALEDTSIAQVVIVTGNGHADRRWGAPVAIGKAAPMRKIVVLGLVEPGWNGEEAFDFIMTRDAPVRDDPCAVFEDS